MTLYPTDVHCKKTVIFYVPQKKRKSLVFENEKNDDRILSLGNYYLNSVMLIPNMTIFSLRYIKTLFIRLLFIVLLIIGVIVYITCDVMMYNNFSIQIVMQWVVVKKYKIS